jgi:formylglycine-generating enzyme required for sulfatase activity
MTARYHGRSLDLLPAHAWYQSNSGEHARARGFLAPNDLGLFDVLGNVYEWCQDVYEDYGTGDLTIDDIIKSESLTEPPRLLRGGSFDDRPTGVRSADRARSAPTYCYTNFGFRPARTYP